MSSTLRRRKRSANSLLNAGQPKSMHAKKQLLERLMRTAGGRRPHQKQVHEEEAGALGHGGLQHRLQETTLALVDRQDRVSVVATLQEVGQPVA